MNHTHRAPDSKGRALLRPCCGCDALLTMDTCAGLLDAQPFGLVAVCRPCRQRAEDSTVFGALLLVCASQGATVPAVISAFKHKGLTVPTTPAEWERAARVLGVKGAEA